MSVDVTVLRVFTDSAGNFGNPLGVVDAATVEPDIEAAMEAREIEADWTAVSLAAHTPAVL